MGGPFELYEQLIAGIPASSVTEACVVGRSWTAVAAEGLGVAMTFRDEFSRMDLRGPVVGRPLAELAEFARSWSLGEASAGVAAINAHYNSRERVEQWIGRSLEDEGRTSAFTAFADELVGKKVAVIGHFPDLEHLAAICDLKIFERHPQPGDYPDYAAEYLLPQQDYVFITGTTLINKTFPRLLELSRNAYVVLTGPSVPLAPMLFEWGVDALAGSVALDQESVLRVIAEGGVRSIWRDGAVTVQLRASEYARPLVAEKDGRQ